MTDHWLLPAICIPLYLAGMASYLGVWYWVAIDRFPLVGRERLVAARAEFLMSDREFQLWVKKAKQELLEAKATVEIELAVARADQRDAMRSRDEYVAAWRELGWLIREVERYLPGNYGRDLANWVTFESVVSRVQGHIHRLYELRPPHCDAFIGPVDVEVKNLRHPYTVIPDFRLREVTLDRVAICVTLSLALGETMPPELLLPNIRQHIEAKVGAMMMEKWGKQSFVRRKV